MITKRSLFSWILHRYWPLQLLLLLVIVASIFFRVVPLELQKRIINVAIALKKTDLLLLYCALYLGAVILFSSLKYVINMLQAYIGQKILLEMRDELYQHILRLPLQFFRQTQPGTVITSLMAELGAVGGFIGSALAIPITSILTLLTFAVYDLPESKTSTHQPCHLSGGDHPYSHPSETFQSLERRSRR
jgi:ABC-type multidrug transport system fused ATPase/permease subunit